MDRREAAGTQRAADLGGELRRPRGLLQAAVAGELEVECIAGERMPASVAVEDHRRRRFLEDSDRVDDADLFQREDVLAGVSKQGAREFGERKPSAMRSWKIAA